MSALDYAPPAQRPAIDLDAEHRRRIAKQDQVLAVAKVPADPDMEHRQRMIRPDVKEAIRTQEPIAEPDWEYGAEGIIPKAPIVDTHINLAALERELVADPEREHAAAFLRLTYGVVMSMCRRIEGKPPDDPTYDENVAKLAAKMYYAAAAKVAE